MLLPLDPIKELVSSMSPHALGVAEFAAEINRGGRSEQNAFRRFCRLVRRERKAAIQEIGGLESDEESVSTSASLDTTSTNNSRPRKSHRTDEAWKEDTANYKVPFVGTSVSSMGDSGRLVVGQWPTGFLKAYLERSPRAVEITMSESTTVDHIAALAELVTAAVPIERLRSNKNPEDDRSMESWPFLAVLLSRLLKVLSSGSLDCEHKWVLCQFLWLTTRSARSSLVLALQQLPKPQWNEPGPIRFATQLLRMHDVHFPTSMIQDASQSVQLKDGEEEIERNRLVESFWDALFLWLKGCSRHFTVTKQMIQNLFAASHRSETGHLLLEWLLTNMTSPLHLKESRQPQQNTLIVYGFNLFIRERKNARPLDGNTIARIVDTVRRSPITCAASVLRAQPVSPPNDTNDCLAKLHLVSRLLSLQSQPLDEPSKIIPRSFPSPWVRKVLLRHQDYNSVVVLGTLQLIDKILGLLEVPNKQNHVQSDTVLKEVKDWSPDLTTLLKFVGSLECDKRKDHSFFLVMALRIACRVARLYSAPDSALVMSWSKVLFASTTFESVTSRHGVNVVRSFGCILEQASSLSPSVLVKICETLLPVIIETQSSDVRSEGRSVVLRVLGFLFASVNSRKRDLEIWIDGLSSTTLTPFVDQLQNLVPLTAIVHWYRWQTSSCDQSSGMPVSPLLIDCIHTNPAILAPALRDLTHQVLFFSLLHDTKVCELASYIDSICKFSVDAKILCGLACPPVLSYAKLLVCQKNAENSSITAVYHEIDSSPILRRLFLYAKREMSGPHLLRCSLHFASFGDDARLQEQLSRSFCSSKARSRSMVCYKEFSSLLAGLTESPEQFLLFNAQTAAVQGIGQIFSKSTSLTSIELRELRKGSLICGFLSPTARLNFFASILGVVKRSESFPPSRCHLLLPYWQRVASDLTKVNLSAGVIACEALVESWMLFNKPLERALTVAIEESLYRTLMCPEASIYLHMVLTEEVFNGFVSTGRVLDYASPELIAAVMRVDMMKFGTVVLAKAQSLQERETFDAAFFILSQSEDLVRDNAETFILWFEHFRPRFVELLRDGEPNALGEPFDCMNALAHHDFFLSQLITVVEPLTTLLSVAGKRLSKMPSSVITLATLICTKLPTQDKLAATLMLAVCGVMSSSLRAKTTKRPNCTVLTVLASSAEALVSSKCPFCSAILQSKPNAAIDMARHFIKFAVGPLHEGGYQTIKIDCLKLLIQLAYVAKDEERGSCELRSILSPQSPSSWFQLVVTHSNFPRCVENRSDPVGLEVLRFLRACITESLLFERSRWVQFVELYRCSLTAYDKVVRSILFQYGDLAKNCDDVALGKLGLDNNLEKGSPSNWVVNVLEITRTKATLRDFPYFDSLNPHKTPTDQLTMTEGSGETTPYSPAFLLSQVYSLFQDILFRKGSLPPSMPAQLEITGDLVALTHKLCEKGMVALATMALSCRCDDVRSLAFVVLGIITAIVNSSTAASYSPWRCRPQAAMFLNSVQGSLKRQRKTGVEVPQLPGLSALFLSRASMLLQAPGHALYPFVNRVFLRIESEYGAFQDLFRLPSFLTLICSSSDDSEQVTVDRRWALQLVHDGFLDDCCYKPLVACHGVELLLSIFTASPERGSVATVYREEFSLVLKTLRRLLKRGGERCREHLLKRLGLLSWCRSILVVKKRFVPDPMTRNSFFEMMCTALKASTSVLSREEILVATQGFTEQLLRIAIENTEDSGSASTVQLTISLLTILAKVCIESSGDVDFNSIVIPTDACYDLFLLAQPADYGSLFFVYSTIPLLHNLSNMRAAVFCQQLLAIAIKNIDDRVSVLTIVTRIVQAMNDPTLYRESLSRKLYGWRPLCSQAVASRTAWEECRQILLRDVP